MLQVFGNTWPCSGVEASTAAAATSAGPVVAGSKRTSSVSSSASPKSPFAGRGGGGMVGPGETDSYVNDGRPRTQGGDGGFPSLSNARGQVVPVNPRAAGVRHLARPGGPGLPSFDASRQLV